MTAPTNFSSAMMRAVMSPAGPACGASGRHTRRKMFVGFTVVNTLYPESQMTAFYIGQHEIDDEAAFADYLKIERHGGRYLTKASIHEMLEGQRPNRVVVVEFPSKQAIKDWYTDPAYRPLIAKRHAAARSVMMAVEGQ